MSEKLYQWAEIRDDFKHTLVLGNGASIAVDSCFSYRSLYEEAEKALLLNDAIKKLFNHYSTQDFEFVLRLVWRAHQINSLFAIEDTPVADAYLQVRDSLIQTVQRVHVDYGQAADYLPSIAGFLHRFRNVLSIDYIPQMHFRMLTNIRPKFSREHTASASRIIASRCLTVTGNDPVFSDSRRRSTNKFDTMSPST